MPNSISQKFLTKNIDYQQFTFILSRALLTAGRVPCPADLKKKVKMKRLNRLGWQRDPPVTRRRTAGGSTNPGPYGRPSKKRDADIPPDIQVIAIELHHGTIGLPAFGIIYFAILPLPPVVYKIRQDQ